MVRARLLELAERQVGAVNGGDLPALTRLLAGVRHWRLPSLGQQQTHGKGGVGAAVGGWAAQMTAARALATQVFIDEERRCAAVEWALRYRHADDGPGGSGGRQLLGGTSFELDDGLEISAWRSYCDGGRAHTPVPRLDFGDLDPALSPWRPAPPLAAPCLTRRRDSVMALLRREAALWAMTEVPPEESRPAFERVFAESAKLINPWTVELSRESRWEGFRSFCANYTDCSVDITHLTLDNERPSLFAVERKFRCTNRETGVRGVDEDWAVGEVVAGEEGGLRLRFCRVYFEPELTGSQEKRKSTGSRLGWDLPSVVNV